MKILIPVTKFGQSGGYRVLSKLADEFIDQNHEVDFICSIFSDRPYYPTKAPVLWADTRGNLLDNPIGPARGAKPLICLYNGLRKIGEDRYDIVLANGFSTTYPVYFSKIKSNLFYYIQAYEPDFFSGRGIRNRFLRFLSEKSYSLPFKKIVNASLYRRYREIHADDVVLPGLDLEMYFPKPAWAKKPCEKWKLGTIGRKEPYKGTSYIIEAFQIIRRARKDMELYIAFGDKDFHSPEDGIFVVEPHGDKQLSDFYRDIDIYICGGTIQHGAVHYPVIESMACGAAVITTPYYPADEQNAWMIIAGQTSEIVEQVKAVADCNADEFILKKRNALSSVEQFRWSSVASGMLDIFNRALK